MWSIFALGVKRLVLTLVRIARAHSNISDVASLNNIVKCLHRLLDGSVSIRPVGVDQVYIVETQALEGRVHSLKDMLAGEALVVGTVAGAEEDLGGDDEVGATPAELLDDTAPACKCQTASGAYMDRGTLTSQSQSCRTHSPRRCRT